MVLPYLEYANCFLVGCKVSEKAKLQRLQNKGLKIALGKDRLYSTEQLHNDAKISYWEIRTKIDLCRLIRKYKYSDDYISRRLDTRLHDGPVFHIDAPKSEWYKTTTSYVCREVWNSLPSGIRLIDNHDMFKRAGRNHFTTIGQESSTGALA